MDAAAIRRLKPKLVKYLKHFEDCFSRRGSREHLMSYVQGQLSDLERKSVEPIALAADIPPRTLQQFLNSLVWNQEQLRDSLQHLVVRDHGSQRAIGIIDETGCPKKGDKTPGVQRQWCGASGKPDNCVVTVHLGYAVDDFRCLLDSELFLPESWSQDRERCRAAAIPDEVTYRPKWRIALELLDRARDNGLSFAWLVFDEGYGGKPEFLRELQAREQPYVAEVPRSFTGWLKPPRITERPFHRHGQGRGRSTPRLMASSPPAQSVEHHLNWTTALKDQPWVKWRVKDGSQGPIVWETKQARLTPKDERGLPGAALHLIVARNVLDPNELKYFVSNAPAETPLEQLLLVAFSRWNVERCFEDEKTELGLDHFEGRSYLGLKRHQVITAVSHLFLARMHQELRGEKPGVDGVPSADCGSRFGPLVVAGPDGEPPAPGSHCGPAELYPAPQRRRPSQPHQTHPSKTQRPRPATDRLTTLSLEPELAL
jgi:SRSO17 transposase